MIGLRNTAFVGSLYQPGSGNPFGPVLSLTRDNFESYALGLVANGHILNGGTGWGTASAVEFPFFVLETFETYADGAAGNGSTLTGGINWSGAPTIN